MKVTKKAKSVTVRWKAEEFISHRSEYQCPACRTIFKGTLHGKNIIRFICDCGQELIIKKER